MIVTCDQCGASYRVDEKAIPAGGARITCLRCKHAFVVHPKMADAARGPAAPSPGHEAFASPRPAAAPVDVNSLDFRKVGIQVWKVKLKIGLTYDFNDYKTLAKYLSEGRVSATDLLSHNAKDWVPIGSIPNLEQHFIETYQAAERALAPPPVPEKVEDEQFEDEPTNIMGMAEAGQAANAAASNLAALPSRLSETIPPPPGPRVEEAPSGPVGPTGPKFVDPFESHKQSKKQQARPAAPREEKAAARPVRSSPQAAQAAQAGAQRSGSRAGAAILVAALLGLGGFGAWYWMRSQGAGTTQVAAQPAPAPAPTAVKAEAPSQGEPVVKPEKWSEVPPAGEGAEPAFAVEGDQELIPVRPSDAELRRLERQSGAPSGSASAGATAAASGDPASRAEEAYRRRAWSEAATAYQAALQQSPGNAVWKARLGESLYNLGDAGGAQAPLADAARSGQSAANKWLGHIARDQGDASGAIGYYQLYLKSRPPDASAIQAEVDRLSGG